MATEYLILRSHLLDYIRRARTDPHAQFGIDDLKRYFEGKEINLDVNDWRTIQQIIHEFYIEGIIIPGQRIRPNVISQSHFLRFPVYHLTEYGEKVLENTEYQPYDPDGYLQKLQTDIPAIDPVIIRYLEECLSCFRRNLMLSAAVMLGCAAEKATLLLIGAFANSLQGTAKAKFEQDANPSLGIKRRYDALWKRIQPIAGSLPNGLGDNLGSILDQTFYIIRTTRNDAGHPSGSVIEKETVHANLLLFPTFSKRIYNLIAYFSAE